MKTTDIVQGDLISIKKFWIFGLETWSFRGLKNIYILTVNIN